MTRCERVRTLAAAYDGPIPPAELAAARWGAGAWARLARGADAALIEARLRECIRALGRLRRERVRCGATGAAMRRLVRAVAQYRRAALSLLT